MAGNGEIHVTLAKHVSIKNCMYYDKYLQFVLLYMYSTCICSISVHYFTMSIVNSQVL